MQVDQNKLLNIIMEKTNRKLNELQAKAIVLESQLQLAIEVAESLRKDLEKVNKTNVKSSDKTATS